LWQAAAAVPLITIARLVILPADRDFQISIAADI
jgi:hypothetical protein